MVVHFDLCWQRMSSEGSAWGKEGLEETASLILQLGGKIREKEADHIQARDLLREWKWTVCWGTFLHPKLRGLQMELGWV